MNKVLEQEKARKAYNEVRKPAWEAYEKIEDQAWKVYIKRLAEINAGEKQKRENIK